MSILMIKGAIYKGDSHYKPPNKKETKIHKATIRRNIREKKKTTMIIMRHMNVSLELF